MSQRRSIRSIESIGGLGQAWNVATMHAPNLPLWADVGRRHGAGWDGAVRSTELDRRGSQQHATFDSATTEPPHRDICP